jgi:hypothetical protein
VRAELAKVEPDGYDAVHEVDSRGRVARRYIRSPERGPVYELVWNLALEGRGLQTIQLELSCRGYRTAPRRGNAKPRPFDCPRIGRILNRPVYADLQEHDGELYPLADDWPRFVEPEDFHRLKRERAARASIEGRKRGRPHEGYVLAGLLYHASDDDPLHAEPMYPERRFYVCKAHRDYHEDAPERCAERRFDAARLERLVLGRLDELLGDAGALREQLRVGRNLERDRLGREAHDAAEDAKRALRAADKAAELAAGRLDEDQREVLFDIAGKKRREAKRAQARSDAALDALNAAQDEPEGDADDLLGRLNEALGCDLRAHRDDAKAMNAILREWIATALAYREPGDTYRVQVLLSPHALDRLRGPAGRPGLPTVPQLVAEGMSEAEAREACDRAGHAQAEARARAQLAPAAIGEQEIASAGLEETRS